MKKLTIFALAGALATAAAASPVLADHHEAAEAVDAQKLDAAIAAPIRADDSARDAYRHPKETLEFMQVAPGHTVIEYAPGGGWYTRILAPYLAGEGRLIAVGLPAEGGVPERYRATEESAAAFPGRVAEWTGADAGHVESYIPAALPESLDGAVDRVLVFRMMHNLFRWNVADSELKSWRKTLKPGGMLGIVQHRANADAPFDYADGNRGYLREDALVKFVEAHGFELVGKSEVNANPADTADYERGVWTLPPSYAEGDEDRARYEAIGESDRMTLLFRKTD